MAKDDSAKEKNLPFTHEPFHDFTNKITHTMAFDTPVMEHWLEQEIAQWVHDESSIQRPIAP